VHGCSLSGALQFHSAPCIWSQATGKPATFGHRRMAVVTEPGEWVVRFGDENGLADIPETADAQLGLMDGLIELPCENSLHKLHKQLDLARTPSGSSMDTSLNSPLGSIASTGTGTASASGSHLYQHSSTSARAARRLKIEEIFFQFTCDYETERALNIADLGFVISYLGHRLTEAELVKVKQEADADGGGTLDFGEFVAMAERLDTSAERARAVAHATPPARLFASPAKSVRERDFRRIFVACMQPENQTIATNDLRVVIRLLGYNLSEEEVKKVASEAYEDDGGSLDYDEFLAMGLRLDEVYGQPFDI